MTSKRRNYWDSETFPLVENRHVVGKLVRGKEPYERTMPLGEQARLEVVARKEAPPRHCLTCGKVLPKRVRVQINRATDEVVMGSIEYGYRGKGYWNTLKCMRVSAPKLAAGLIKVRSLVDSLVERYPEMHSLLHEIREADRQALNHFHHHFD